MDLGHYEYHVGEEFLDYEFYSDGPKGAILKVVRFTLVRSTDFEYFNLGFGDWNKEKSRIDDFVISNNRDAERVLSTVASTVLDFTDHYPDAIVYAEGSTRSRTRRYQMGINKYWDEIRLLFDLYGLIENEGFQPFERQRNYKAFLIKRKNE